MAWQQCVKIDDKKTTLSFMLDMYGDETVEMASQLTISTNISDARLWQSVVLVESRGVRSVYVANNTTLNDASGNNW